MSKETQYRKKETQDESDLKAPQSTQAAAPDQTTDNAEAVSFNDWFVTSLKTNRKLRAHHYDAVLTFFKHKNLTEREAVSDFDAMLTVFGF